MPDMTTCDTVAVTIKHPPDPDVTLTVPAYTVPEHVLRERVASLAGIYCAVAWKAGESMSLADFALYLLAQAQGDPTEQPATGATGATEASRGHRESRA